MNTLEMRKAVEYGKSMGWIKQGFNQRMPVIVKEPKRIAVQKPVNDGKKRHRCPICGDMVAISTFGHSQFFMKHKSLSTGEKCVMSNGKVATE